MSGFAADHGFYGNKTFTSWPLWPKLIVAHELYSHFHAPRKSKFFSVMYRLHSYISVDDTASVNFAIGHVDTYFLVNWTLPLLMMMQKPIQEYNGRQRCRVIWASRCIIARAIWNRGFRPVGWSISPALWTKAQDSWRQFRYEVLGTRWLSRK